MPSDTIVEAERLSRRRARMMPALAIMFVSQQMIFFTTTALTDELRPVNLVRNGAWVLLTLVLLAGLSTTGFWFKSREVRALLEDEGTRAHRARAVALGFLAAMLVAIGLYVATVFQPLDSRIVLHAVISAGIATGLIRFAMLERRALKDG